MFACTIAAQTGAVPLELNRSHERELKGGESHLYSINIKADQYVHFAAEQNGIDVVVVLSGPDGRKIVEVDSPNGTRGDEPVWFISEFAGEFQVEVRSLEANAGPGRYKIELRESRPVGPSDADMVAASMALVEARQFAAQRGPENARSAAAKYKFAIERFGSAGDQKRVALASADLAEFYQFLPDPALSIEFNEKALAIFEAEGMKGEVGVVLARLGEVNDYLRNYHAAQQFYERALKVAETVDDRRTMVVSLNNVGLVRQKLEDFSAATDFYKRGLAVAEAMGWPDGIAACLNNLGVVSRWRGSYVEALNYQMRQLDVLRSAKRNQLIPRTLQNIGDIYTSQGEYELGLKYAFESIEGFKRMNARYNVSQVENNVGVIYLNRGDNDNALAFFNKANEFNVRNRIEDPVIIQNIGLVHHNRGEYAEAIKAFEKVLDMSRGKSRNASRYLADTYAAMGDHEKALKYALQSIGITQPLGLRNETLTALKIAGDASVALNRTDEAKRYYLQAIDTIEDLRPQAIGNIQGRGRFFEKHLSSYYALIGLEIKARNFEKAYLLAERARSRSLLDVLNTVRTDISKTMNDEELASEKRLREELVAVNAQLSAEGLSESKISELERSRENKRREYDDFTARLYAVHPELRAKRAEMPVSTMAEAASSLDRKSVAVEYVVDQNKTYAFVVSNDPGPNGSIPAVYTVQIGVDEISKKAAELRSKMAAGDLDFQKFSRELHDLLLKSAIGHLDGRTNVIILPDGPLWDLPFQALMDEKGRYLIEKAAVSYAPSLTALREMRKKAATRKEAADAELLAFGNPTVGKETKERVQRVFMSEKLEPLPEAERLVNELGKMYGPKRSKVFVGADAREEIAKNESPKYRIVQFATHGILNNISPMYSHLVFAQNDKNPNEDGLLEAWELKDLDLKADMVILSACETARGKIANGEGVIGMTWASFIAGAPTTVASQWKVESSSTTELMLEFHRQLLAKQRVSKAEALRRASLKVMKMSRYRHPMYWAGFVLVGDGS